MINHSVTLLHGILGLLLGGHGEPMAPAQGPPLSKEQGATKGVKLLTRGPIHEAFAALDVPAPKEERREEDHKYVEHFAKCAKMIAACQLECDACFNHCAQRVADGATEHARSMRLCLDCAELCSTAARLTVRHSPLSAVACEACAKGCDLCATSCEQVSADKSMAACAKVCRECAKECREMVKRSSRSP
jgi:hypothetical protein